MLTEKTKLRRSRIRRTRTGKRIELTSRDLAIFKLLDQYRYLRSTYLQAFVGGQSVTRFKERLGDLFHEGYLDRPAEQWAFSGARHQPVVYEIGTGAIRALQEAGSEANGRQSAHRQFRHSLMICEVLASIDLVARATPNLRLVRWPEILGRAPEATRLGPAPLRVPTPPEGFLVPDGLFGLEYGADGTRSYRFFALEVDRGTMPVSRSDPRQTSYLGKLATYRDLIERGAYKAHWGIPNLLVLTVTPSEARCTSMMQSLSRDTRSSAAFLFKSVLESDLRVPHLGLLHEPWMRACDTALRIDAP